VSALDHLHLFRNHSLFILIKFINLVFAHRVRSLTSGRGALVSNRDFKVTAPLRFLAALAYH
jgi:hypothetical protein